MFHSALRAGCLKGKFAETCWIGLNHAVGIRCAGTFIGRWKTKIKARLRERKEENKEANKGKKENRKRVFLYVHINF